jgi:hypothetical protein
MRLASTPNDQKNIPGVTVYGALHGMTWLTAIRYPELLLSLGFRFM